MKNIYHLKETTENQFKLQISTTRINISNVERLHNWSHCLVITYCSVSLQHILAKVKQLIISKNWMFTTTAHLSFLQQ